MGVFDGSIGAFVIGTILSMYLAGVTTTQVVTYCVNFWERDRWLFKSLVMGLFVVDLFHSAISVYTIYHWAVNFTDLSVLVKSPWTFSIDPAVTGITTSVRTSPVLADAYRIFRISGEQPYIPIAIITLSMVQLGFACGGTLKIFLLNSEFARFQEWTYGVTVWLVSAAICDVMITASMVAYLRRTTGAYQKTNSVIYTILLQTVETNGLTMSIALLDAILFAASNESWHVIPNLCLVKLYFNSLLVSLNSRKELKTSLQHSGNTGGSSGLTKSGDTSMSGRSKSHPFQTLRSTRSFPKTTPGAPAFTVNVSHVNHKFVESVSVCDSQTESVSLSTPTRPFSDLKRVAAPHPYAISRTDLTTISQDLEMQDMIKDPAPAIPPGCLNIPPSSLTIPSSSLHQLPTRFTYFAHHAEQQQP
ncbi:hypothetical protein T439DRAFT_357419 [Meredithblackwellia eburnea MCA 4105]